MRAIVGEIYYSQGNDQSGMTMTDANANAGKDDIVFVDPICMTMAIYIELIAAKEGSLQEQVAEVFD